MLQQVVLNNLKLVQKTAQQHSAFRGGLRGGREYGAEAYRESELVDASEVQRAACCEDTLSELSPASKKQIIISSKSTLLLSNYFGISSII